MLWIRIRYICILKFVLIWIRIRTQAFPYYYIIYFEEKPENYFSFTLYSLRKDLLKSYTQKLAHEEIFNLGGEFFPVSPSSPFPLFLIMWIWNHKVAE